VSGAAGAEAYALRAGTDLNCPGTEATLADVQQAISGGILSEGVIDDALIRVFTTRMETGEFDPPGRECAWPRSPRPLPGPRQS
jgi:beta-glucosidase-like glycosyl hydrolase